MPSPNAATHEIVIPTPDDAADMMHLRARLYTQELITSGVSEAAAQAHTEDWGSPESLKEYGEIIEDWLEDPAIFVRTIQEKTNERREIKGLFLGALPTLESPLHFVRVIQLDETIRRKGIGRHLFRTMSAVDPVAPMELNVFVNNAPANRFYSALGFTATAHIDETYLIGDDLVAMKRLRREPEQSNSW